MKKLLVALCILLMIAGLIIYGMYEAEKLPSREATLLQRCSISLPCRRKTLHHSYWKDWLWYTDGYEVYVFRSRDDIASSLVGWQSGHFTLSDAVLLPDDTPSEAALSEIPDGCLPESYTHLFFRQEKDDYWLALYDETTKICLIYRGHHLYFL